MTVEQGKTKLSIRANQKTKLAAIVLLLGEKYNQ